jgi:hypothetical protein
MTRFASRLVLLVLLMLATAGMVLQSGSVPHAHRAIEPSFFNEEHDLTLLAGLSAHVVLAGAAPALSFDIASTDIRPSVPERPASSCARSAASRAPPLA